MLFALADYVQYRLRWRRYGEGVGAGAMALGFVGSIPNEVVDQLEVGDTIFTQRLNSILSWGTMYFASSEVDHCALYIGNGQVGHMTLAGTRKHSVQALARGARVLPARLNNPLGDEAIIRRDRAGVGQDGDDDRYAGLTFDGGYIDRRRRPSHVLPPKLQLVYVACRLVVGCYISRYRWKYSADVVFTAIFIDVPVFLLTGWLVALPISAAILILTAYNILKWKIRKAKGLGYELISHPDIFLSNLTKYGGVIFTHMGPLSISDLGLLPLKLFLDIEERLGLSREGADDRADD